MEFFHFATEADFREVERLKKSLDSAESVLLGAVAGLSTSAGFTYSGERFFRYFSDIGNVIFRLQQPD